MEVMIAVYAVSAMNSFCEKVNEILNIGEHLLESVFRNGLQLLPNMASLKK